MAEEHQRERQFLDVPGDSAIAVHRVEGDGIAGGDDDPTCWKARHAADQAAQEAARGLRLSGEDQKGRCLPLAERVVEQFAGALAS